LSTAVAAAITASLAFNLSAFVPATPSSFQATSSKASDRLPFLPLPSSATAGWQAPFDQLSSVLCGTPICRAVLSTLPPLAASAARAFARSSSL
jgi:hypothetical protein